MKDHVTLKTGVMADENSVLHHMNKLYKCIKMEIIILYYDNINIYIYIYIFYLYYIYLHFIYMCLHKCFIVHTYIQVHLNKLECRGKVHLFSVIQLKL